jgi:2-polyprenyl-3-methyl-5-hydroxy-6-metoxy-1,4-benzoquinol methylase
MTEPMNAEPRGSIHDQIKMFGFRVWTYRMGEQVSLMIHLGDRLGIYRAMAGQGPISSIELARRLSFDERLLREWLYGQAAAGLIDRVSSGSSDEPETARFELTPVQRAVLADEDESIAFAAGAFSGGASPEVIDRIAESFTTGVGITYEDQGPAAAAALGRMTGPWSRHALVSTILPALDGVVERLEAGIDVLDIGCGTGFTLCLLAEAFPASRCVGYDSSESAVRLARERAAHMGLHNVEFVASMGHELPADPRFGFVLTFDCLHDMTRPDLTAAAIHAAMEPGGTWLIKDIRSSGDFETDSRNPMLALFYGFSIAHCLQSSLSEPGGLGLGTLGLHPDRLQALVTAAGFGPAIVHDFDDASNLYFEIRR